LPIWTPGSGNLAAVVLTAAGAASGTSVGFVKYKTAIAISAMTGATIEMIKWIKGKQFPSLQRKMKDIAQPFRKWRPNGRMPSIALMEMS
jgi:hypothetical protein